MNEHAARRLRVWEQAYNAAHYTALSGGMSEEYADLLASRTAQEAVADWLYREEQQRTREAKANE